MARKAIADIDIDDFIFPNKGVGTYENHRVTVKNALPGQKVRALVGKKRKTYEGKLMEIIAKAPCEVQPACPQAGVCGGCIFQTLAYEDELVIKKNMVAKLFEAHSIALPEPLHIHPAPEQEGYRNKMEFSFGDEEKGGSLALGMRKSGSFYEVADASCCTLCHKDFGKIVKATRDYFRQQKLPFYHKTTHMGVLRHLGVRKGIHTGEILVNLVTTSQLEGDLDPYAALLQAIPLDGTLVGILHTVNDSVADVVQADKLRLLYGQDCIHDQVLGLTFKISPFSFFQTNTKGAEALYATVREYAGDARDKVLFDLYCGTGTIAQIVSKNARHVYGIELVEEAVAAARENAQANGINNCTFIAGDVLRQIQSLEERPHLIILDPPREGIHPKAIQHIIDFGAERIIYVSCKPTSLMRDLEILLAQGYKLASLRLHDMFPRSYHVETVVLLERVAEN